MDTVHIPELKRDVSRLGLGGAWFRAENQDLAFSLLDRFRELGGNIVDTGRIYGDGEAEQTLGRWLADRDAHADFMVLDKGCHHPPHDFGPQAIHDDISRGLDCLGVDYIDLWLFHRDKRSHPVGPLIDALNEEVARGRIRAFGCSNWSRARLAEANEYARANGLMGMAVASPNLALATPREPYWSGCTHATEEDVAWHARAGVPIIAWSSQAAGFFRDDSSPENTRDPNLVRVYHSPENFEKLRRARELASEKGASAVQIALAWTLHQPAPVVALVGPHTIGEVDSCVAALEIKLTQAEVDWLALRRDDR